MKKNAVKATNVKSQIPKNAKLTKGTGVVNKQGGSKKNMKGMC